MARPVPDEGVHSSSHEPFHATSSSESGRLAPGPSGKTFAEEHPLKILVADDNYINRRVFTMFLTHHGYQADCVENGLECLNAALDGRYDLIMTDLEMPEMTGIECTRELRRAGVKSRIVAVSASDLENARETCLAIGMDGFLPKPFPPDELRQILRETHQRKTKVTTLQSLPSIT